MTVYMADSQSLDSPGSVNLSPAPSMYLRTSWTVTSGSVTSSRSSPGSMRASETPKQLTQMVIPTPLLTFPRKNPIRLPLSTVFSQTSSTSSTSSRTRIRTPPNALTASDVCNLPPCLPPPPSQNSSPHCSSQLNVMSMQHASPC